MNKKNALIAGTFDPLTVGHEDVVRRSADLFDKVYVAVVKNDSKRPAFTAEERVELCKKVFSDDDRIEIICDDGLISDLAERLNCGTVVKGIRNTNDFVYEYEHSQIYRGMTPSLETVFIPACAEYIHVSSSAVRAIASLGGDVSSYVPKCILEDVNKKFNHKEN